MLVTLTTAVGNQLRALSMPPSGWLVGHMTSNSIRVLHTIPILREPLHNFQLPDTSPEPLQRMLPGGVSIVGIYFRADCERNTQPPAPILALENDLQLLLSPLGIDRFLLCAVSTTAPPIEIYGFVFHSGASQNWKSAEISETTTERTSQILCNLACSAALRVSPQEELVASQIGSLKSKLKQACFFHATREIWISPLHVSKPMVGGDNDVPCVSLDAYLPCSLPALSVGSSPALHVRGSPSAATRVISVKLNALCYLEPTLSSSWHSALVAALSRQLDAVAAVLQGDSAALLSASCLSFYHFHPAELPFPISVPYPSPLTADVEIQLTAYRRAIHDLFGLAVHRPLLRMAQAWNPRAEAPPMSKASGRLRDVHLSVVERVRRELPNAVIATVAGSYEYYHYQQNKENDRGWGCAYRSLQTICSWYRLQGYSAHDTDPNIHDIQRALVLMHDKPAAFVGSRQWIGAVEVGLCLEHFTGCVARILNVAKGADLEHKGRELLTHFQREGTPVMMGGGVLAYTLLGIAYDELDGNVRFLILDPHYEGEENLRMVIDKGWCGWKKGIEVFKQDAFYNLCLPQAPKSV